MPIGIGNRRRYRDFSIDTVDNQLMFFEDPIFAPSSGTVELGDIFISIQVPKAVNTVHVTMIGSQRFLKGKPMGEFYSM
jgi:hypothetical protein